MVRHRHYMHTCSSVSHHYTSPSNADSQANNHWRTTEATSSHWRIGALLLPVKAQPGTKYHGELPQTGRRAKAGERLGTVETPHVSDAMFSRTHSGANRGLHLQRQLFLRALALAPVNHYHGTITWRRRTTRHICRNRPFSFVRALLGCARRRQSASHVISKLTRGKRTPGLHNLCPGRPDWAVTPLHWHCMRRSRPLRPEDALALGLHLPPAALCLPLSSYRRIPGEEAKE
jgi:hypothetical protein